MNQPNSAFGTPDYGLDAPGVVRNLFIIGAVGLLLWGSTAIGIWSGQAVLGPIAGVNFFLPVGTMGLCGGLGCSMMGVWMVWSSKVGKIKTREGLLNHISWAGDEQVLDIGCGRGLMLVGAAKRLTTGKAIGIDKWQEEDLANNRPEGTLENARLENVADRVEVKTADMRELPFGDSTFDVVVSCSAIHNIYSKAGRSKAISEIVRVLKPGGQALIDDIRHMEEYSAEVALLGCQDQRRIGYRAVTVLLAVITMGSLRPGTLAFRKSRLTPPTPAAMRPATRKLGSQ
jgi:2-polyprenyl-3-methyl-5-hydroxy-6-metoxy-1,4-benzoquinol methylase